MKRIKSLLTSRFSLGIVGALAVIAVVSFFYFYPDNVEGRVLNQYDMLQGEANSHEVNEYKAETGSVSWWTNSLFGGMPTFQISPEYASKSLFSWINTVYGLGLPAPSNLLAMMMTGMLLLLLAMRVRPWLSLIGAVAWGLSSYYVIIIGAGHLWKFLTLTYVPPTIAGLVLIYSGRRWLGAGVAALFMMLQLAGNHVQMTYYFSWVMLGFIIAYGVRACKEKKMKQWGISSAIFAGAMLLAVGANAPSLYHTYKYAKETIRGSHSELTQGTDASQATSGLDRDYITRYSYEPSETFTLLIPNIKGGSSQLTLADTGKGKEIIEEHPEYEESFNGLPQYFGGEEGTSGPVYVGAIIMALALFGAIVVRGPVKWALVGLTVLSVLLAWGRHLQGLTDLFIDIVPMYSQFRTVESILVIAEFTLPVLAILGLREFFVADGRRRFLKPLAISFGLCAAACLAAIAVPSVFGSDFLWGQEREFADQLSEAQNQGYDVSAELALIDGIKDVRVSLVRGDALRSLMYLLVGFGALGALIYRPRIPAGAALAVVGVAVAADLYTADKRYLNSEKFADPLDNAVFTPSEADRRILADPDPHFRVADFNRFDTPFPSYWHKTVGGYHAAKLTRYEDVLKNLLADSRSPEFYKTLDMLNTKYIVYNNVAELNEGALGNAWFVDGLTYVDGADDEMQALRDLDPGVSAVADRRFRPVLGSPSAASPGDEISLTSYAPDRMVYQAHTDKGALAVFSEVYFPWGWDVTIDGKPAEMGRVDYILRGLFIPAGNHEIVMTFRPKSILTTDYVAVFSIALIYLLLLLGALRMWKRSVG